ncbi:hypothetical protein GCM10010276_78940 [Streptomyces longisporus]|uniref:Uncharacterized protein n=1 Tax=Streptomyces longisporus TaxID=1948 RepID=A0ABN3NAT8_STRLO
MIVGSTVLRATKSFGALGSVAARVGAEAAVTASTAASAVIRPRTALGRRVMSPASIRSTSLSGSDRMQFTPMHTGTAGTEPCPFPGARARLLTFRQIP